MTKQYSSEEIARAEGSILTYLKMLEDLSTLEANSIAKYLGLEPTLVLELLKTLESRGEISIKYTLCISLSKAKRSSKKVESTKESESKAPKSNLDKYLNSAYEDLKGFSISKLVEKVLHDGDTWSAFEIYGVLYDLNLAEENGLAPEVFTKPINAALSNGVKSGKWNRVKTGVYQLNNSSESN